MTGIIKALAATLWVLMAGAVVAQDEFVVDAGLVRACFDGTPMPVNGVPPCVGDASAACQAQPGVGTTLGVIGCQAAETEVWDDLLNQTYRDVLAGFEAHDASAGTTPFSRVETLRAAQRAWIGFRDADCRMRYAQFQDGTIRGPVQARCLLRMTAGRTFELLDLLNP